MSFNDYIRGRSLAMVYLYRINFKTKDMKLGELFLMGGIQFMLFVTILGLAMLFFTVRSYVKVFAKKETNVAGINYILMFGSLSFIIGLLGQAIGMIAAFEAIYQAGDISPGLIAGGIRVSMIAPLYGVFYFILSIPLWVVVREKAKKNN